MLSRPISLVEVFDNGSPGIGRDRLIVSSGAVEVGSPVDVPITDCPASLSGVFQYPGVLGPFEPNYDGYTGPQDFVVTDAHPLPTSKDHCKKAGWKASGVFKNQGDCVSFVATGRKNPPAKNPG